MVQIDWMLESERWYEGGGGRGGNRYLVGRWVDRHASIIQGSWDDLNGVRNGIVFVFVLVLGVRVSIVKDGWMGWLGKRISI